MIKCEFTNMSTYKTQVHCGAGRASVPRNITSTSSTGGCCCQWWWWRWWEWWPPLRLKWQWRWIWLWWSTCPQEDGCCFWQFNWSCRKNNKILLFNSMMTLTSDDDDGGKVSRNAELATSSCESCWFRSILLLHWTILRKKGSQE